MYITETKLWQQYLKTIDRFQAKLVIDIGQAAANVKITYIGL